MSQVDKHRANEDLTVEEMRSLLGLEIVTDASSGNPHVFKVDVSEYDFKKVKEGWLRVGTPFAMSDGDHVNIYVRKFDTGYDITDFGDASFRVNFDYMTEEEQEDIKDLCEGLYIDLIGGEMEKQDIGAEDLGPSIVSMAKCAVLITEGKYTDEQNNS